MKQFEDPMPKAITDEIALRIFAHPSMSIHFVAQNDLPENFNSSLPSNISNLQSGKYETGKHHLIVKLTAPEMLTGISQSQEDVFQEWELIERLDFSENSRDGVYVLQACGNVPCFANDFCDNEHHEGKRLNISQNFFEMKFVAAMYVDDRFSDKKLKNTIGLENVTFKESTVYELAKICDCCGNENSVEKYIIYKIKEYRKIPFRIGDQPKFDGFEFHIAFSDVNKSNPNGTIYAYQYVDLNETHNFCSLKCAFDYSVQENVLAIYQDPVKDNHLRAVFPYVVEINENLGLSEDLKYRGQPAGSIN
jgi:hypothetical protein